MKLHLGCGKLKLEVKKSIKKVKKKNYENYFEYAYNKNNKTIKIEIPEKLQKIIKSYNIIISFLLFEPIV